MEMKITSGRAVKRRLEEDGEDDVSCKLYRFQVFLPNGTTVGLTLWNPESEMDMQDFINLVKRNYDSLTVDCPSMRKKRRIDWNGDHLFLEDEVDNKMRDRVNFGCFRPFRWHKLRLHDGSGENVDKFESLPVETVLPSEKENSRNVEKNVVVRDLHEVDSWKLMYSEKHSSYSVRVGSIFPTVHLGRYDAHGSSIPFINAPNLLANLKGDKGLDVPIQGVKGKVVDNGMMLKIENILIETNELDKIRPSYNVSLEIFKKDESRLSVSIPCQVKPGLLQRVLVKPQPLGSLLPGHLVEQLILEMFDGYGNHAAEGSEIKVNVDGLYIQGHLCLTCKVDAWGCVDLSGRLRVVAGYGQRVSLSVRSGDREIIKQEFQTQERELRVASEVPLFGIAGATLNDIIFEVVDSKGDIDKSFHDNEECGQFHTLIIRSISLNTDTVTQYAFSDGRCVVPSLTLPNYEGILCIEAFHSCYVELHVTMKIPLKRTPKVETSTHEANMMFLRHCEKASYVKLRRYAQRIESYEEKVKSLENQKAGIGGAIADLQSSLKPWLMEQLDCLYTEEEMIRQIVAHSGSPAAITCSLSKELRLQMDIIGLVGLLGRVSTSMLSRILAEYLGRKKMLAIVCRSLEAAQALERYTENREIDDKPGLPIEATALLKRMKGRFLVTCMERIRGYAGKFIENDPQQRLALQHPTLPNGKPVPGFMGYAVNMINLDSEQLNIRTAAGQGLRETLFYSLFGELQVYDSREHMEAAFTCFKSGAVSLDGGIFRDDGSLYIGDWTPGICFPMMLTNLSSETCGVVRHIKAKREELRAVVKEIETVGGLCQKARAKFEKQKTKHSRLRYKMASLTKDELHSSPADDSA